MLVALNHSYRYAVEQMLTLLFPEEKTEFTAPGGNQTPEVLSILSAAPQWTSCVTTLRLRGRNVRRVCRAKTARCGPDADPLEAKRVIQYLIRTSLYRASVEVLGARPVWGSLTGVRPAKIPAALCRAGWPRARAEQFLIRRYDVAPDRAALAAACAEADCRTGALLRPGDISLYIGIPFCPTRCAYCSFFSSVLPPGSPLAEEYTAALTQELRAAGEAVRDAGLSVRCIYVGGGTPTTLSPALLARLLDAVRKSFDLSRCLEYTVEAGRPDTITRERLSVLRDGGAGRISVNPQTMQDSVLRAIGRSHTRRDTLRAWTLVREAGFGCVNMDLIAGLPTDTPQGFSETLTEVLALHPENLTVHTLAIKKGTLLHFAESDLPDADEVGAMLDESRSRLPAAGYRPYYLYRQKYMSGAFENVGWCLDGSESIYNVCMMEELNSVLAVGCGGVSKAVFGGTGRIRRFADPKVPAVYLQRLPEILESKRQLVSLLALPAEPENTENTERRSESNG